MKFSIITCTYNSEKYVQNNIDSVKNQTLQNFEHIFIDGLSTDKTIEIIKNYQKEFPNKVKLFQFEPKGIANAMNMGIKNASGEYLIHLHSDDGFYDSKVLEKISRFIKGHSDADLIYGKAKFISDDGSFRIIPHRKIYQKFNYWILLLTNFIPHPATFIKKKIFEKYGLFDEKYNNSMDYEMWLRLSKRKVNAYFFNLIISNFSIRRDSQSSIGAKNSVVEHIDIQEKYMKSKLMRLCLLLITKINSKRRLL